MPGTHDVCLLTMKITASALAQRRACREGLRDFKTYVKSEIDTEKGIPPEIVEVEQLHRYLQWFQHNFRTAVCAESWLFENMVFSRFSCESGSFEGAAFVWSELVKCNFRGISFKYSSWKFCTISNSLFRSTTWDISNLACITFTDTVFNWCDFSESWFSQCLFIRCCFENCFWPGDMQNYPTFLDCKGEPCTVNEATLSF